jgi:hypothetical protein
MFATMYASLHTTTVPDMMDLKRLGMAFLNKEEQ